MARITAPAPFTGAGVGGVEFVDGVAESDDPAVIAYCRDAGYEIEAPTKAPAKKTAAKPSQK